MVRRQVIMWVYNQVQTTISPFLKAFQLTAVNKLTRPNISSLRAIVTKGGEILLLFIILSLFWGWICHLDIKGLNSGNSVVIFIGIIKGPQYSGDASTRRGQPHIVAETVRRQAREKNLDATSEIRCNRFTVGFYPKL
jgi:hypothetical protein